ERLSDDSLSDAPIAVSISEHLRAATGKGTEVAADASARARSTSDIALLKAAVDDIDNQRSQADILNTLVNRAAAFTPRLAFFVVKNERATGWRARGLEGTVGDDAVREISLPLSTETLLSKAVSSRSTWSGAPGTNADDHQLISKLGDEPPQRMVAIPLIARGKCVAVLYADSAALEPDAINLEALETLVRVTSMSVELLAVTRAAPRPAAERATAQPAPVAAEATAPAVVREEKATPAHAVIDPVAASSAPTAGATQETHEPTLVAEPQEERGIEPAFAAEATTTRPPDGAQEAFGDGGERATPAPVSPVAIEPSATDTPPVAAPLGGSSRRSGADAELPVEVSEEERRYHNDARRFARLLVSEIKLYNEQKVRDGREQGNLYERLREEIDRSRQMYDKRVAPNVAARYDYFHHELVNTLAEGNSEKLGSGYPGTSVGV
ncbi:MAG TPA: GAF domain-containing protein, partial [Pyrinomonadaceae bacterium]|nr:GAF domain-containing protein [Pyrinomonadaceae bacterium]